MNDLLTISNGQPTASSRDIAEHFGKEHKNVLQSIENLTAENSALTQMFFKTSYISGTGKAYPMYLMNRDGFTLLAMGFTGKEALEWKVKYINAFNAMEQELRNPKPMTANEMFAMQAQINLESERKLAALEGKVDETNRKFDAVTTFVTSPLTDADTPHPSRRGGIWPELSAVPRQALRRAGAHRRRRPQVPPDPHEKPYVRCRSYQDGVQGRVQAVRHRRRQETPRHV